MSRSAFPEPSDERLCKRKRHRPHNCATLTPSEITLLLESSLVFVRSHALYALALGAGLATRHLHALDLGDVTRDGTLVVERVSPRRLTRSTRRAPSFVLNVAVRRALSRYLTWRRARCAHFKAKLRTYVDATGVERCLACKDVADALRAPLFVSQKGTRLSARQMREEFGRWRTELGLNPKIRFDSMRATYRDTELLRDGSYLGALIREGEP